MATFEDFQKLDIRVWKIIEVQNFTEARKPSYKLKIDFWGDIWIKRSHAQLFQNYSIEELKEKQVLCVINFSPRQIWPAISEVLVLGVPDENGECILIKPDKEVSLWWKLY